ncbi:MAG TPA: DUF4350 domain-containing protein [Candidatus Nanopelagicales bacterium]|nr:DUF4350 domain-containing protein [Candidatus Nanopelagicales bacterium]
MSLLADETPTVGDTVRRNRGTVVIVLVLVVVAVIVAVAQSRRTAGVYDPDGLDRPGSHALAALLEDQGASVVRVTTAAEAADAVSARDGDVTLLIVPTAPLSPRMLAAVSGLHPVRTVLVQPDADTLAALAPWASVGDFASGGGDERAAGCDWGVAQQVGTLPPDGSTYTTHLPGAHACWGGLVLDDSGTRADGVTTILGPGQALTNDRLADSGYAALSLNTIGHAPTVVWWLPSLTDPLQFSSDAPPTVQDLVPSWVGWALLQVALAMLVVVWWRSRRLGRVVVEPLPVVVRATESVEGRARLYRRGGARGRAADALREGTATRLRSRLGLPRTADDATLAAAVAARTGRPAPDVLALLQPGSAPSDDASLTALADALDTLENEVRRS